MNYEFKKIQKNNALEEARERIAYTFNEFNKYYLSFSGGKDSSVMFHLVMEEAIKRNEVVAIMVIDFEAQYKATSFHVQEMLETYKDNIEPYWICLPMALRNAVSNFEPRWTCWDEKEKEDWVRPLPSHENVIDDLDYFPFFEKGMEFEEFVILFGEWYGKGEKTANFIGIRYDESLNRFRTIATQKKAMYEDKKYTTKISENLYNIYPIYDWRTSDIWLYHSKYPEKQYNKIYDLMNKAGVKYSQQRLCQPYGDDQKRGLWLYHILEPETWYKIVNRVSGVNSGALYVRESGNITGSIKISKPNNHTYKSYANLLLSTMPKKTRDHYIEKFTKFLTWWKKRGYELGIPDEAPPLLESKGLAPSWKRLCKVLLRNDYWCKGLHFSQPKSAAYERYMDIKKAKKNG